MPKKPGCFFCNEGWPHHEYDGPDCEDHRSQWKKGVKEDLREAAVLNRDRLKRVKAEAAQKTTDEIMLSVGERTITAHEVAIDIHRSLSYTRRRMNKMVVDGLLCREWNSSVGCLIYWRRKDHG